MEQIVERKEYLNRLIAKRNNGFVKVITGVRRCGKSFLLFKIYKNYLLEDGVGEDHIVCLALDNIMNAAYRDPLALSEYLEERIPEDGKTTYIFLDEIQFVGRKKIGDNPEIYITFYDVLNSLLQKGNTDIYVTGSNSRMLSKDIATEFRGRGDEIHIRPFSFAEIYAYKGGDKSGLFAEYLMYGGMPAAFFKENEAEKKKYLSNLFRETYLKDILERQTVKYPEILGMIAAEVCSAVGSLTNANKIANTLCSENNTKIDSETVAAYLGYLTDAFLFSRADRYDVKGRKYFSYPSKYYCIDMGLRNANLNFRQMEESHLMENIIYNELRSRDYSVDVGVVDITESKNGKQTRTAAEIDFVVNAQTPGERYYIQSALSIEEPGKAAQELRPFMKLKNDFTKRVVITRTMMKGWTDEFGIYHIGIYDFLLGNSMI